MPKTYLIGHLAVSDAATYKAYSTAVPDIVKSHGGQYLVRGGQSRNVEGTTGGDRHVVMVFPDRQAAEDFYSSAAYQAILPIRLKSSKGSILLVDGLD